MKPMLEKRIDDIDDNEVRNTVTENVENVMLDIFKLNQKLDGQFPGEMSYDFLRDVQNLITDAHWNINSAIRNTKGRI